MKKPDPAQENGRASMQWLAQVQEGARPCADLNQPQYYSERY